MRFLRDTSFLSWVAVVAILGGLLAFAHTLGTGSGPAPLPFTGGQVALIASDESDARVQVDKLAGLAPYGIAAGTDPSALSAWARELTLTSRKGAEIRAGEGAGPDDPMYSTFGLIEQRAARLVAAGDDAVAINSTRTNILLLIDRAIALSKGLPVPEGVQNLGGGSVTPADPAVPDLDLSPITPNLPSPLPGDRHPHPKPDLTPDPPTAEDQP